MTEPELSEDVGKDWQDPAALTEYGDREPTEPWTWAGPARAVTGPTWGGRAEVVQWILTAGRFPTDPAVWATHPASVDPPLRRRPHGRRRVEDLVGGLLVKTVHPLAA